MRKARAIMPTDEQRKQLTAWAHSHTVPQRLVFRARIVLAAAEGKQNLTIAATLGTTRSTIAKWRERFQERGTEGLLKDAPRPGRPPKHDTDEAKEIVRRTLESRPENATHWSTRSMAKAMGIPRMRICRVWQANQIKPHRTRSFKLSNDPRFEEKVTDIVGLDNYATHKHEDVKKWLSKHPRFHLHFTPTSSSWLNLVERWFGELTSKNIRRGSFRSVGALVKSIEGFIAKHNSNPRAFQWTAKAEVILQKVARAKAVLVKRT